MVGRLLLSCGLVLLCACAGASSAPPSPPAPSATTVPQVADVRAAVFEVVIAKLENPNMQYAEPLPVHLLPHHQRTDAYHSIGTAFTLDGTTFVSAAHVFSLHLETQFADRRLRGEDGTIYEIDQFVRHSGVRDLVVFTLRDPPVVTRPLARGAQPEVGAQVHTVGFALGEGLAVRGGNVSSFTPEPLESAWDFIRYSAPASPGNSGGPLLDDQGRVVGVVVRKSSEENLNYAVPIAELDRLSASRADFYARQVESESGQRLVADWQTEVALPASYRVLAGAGKAAYYDAILEHRVAFEARFRDLLFPTAVELRTYLREQPAYYYPAELVRDPSGRWSLGEATSASSYEVSPEQSLYVGKTGDYLYLVLERSDEVPLATFVNEPQRVIDAMLRSLDITRTYAGAKIRVTSYGAPHHHEAWRDSVGRAWTSTTWRLVGDMSSTLHCMPYPRGLACILTETQTAGEPIHLAYARINAPRWTLSYDGRLKDWIEFFALEPALRPTFLTGAVTLTDGKLAATLGPISLATSRADLSGDSVLVADTHYASLSPPALRISGAAITTTKTRGLSLRVNRVAEPLATGAQGWRDYWDALVAQRAPYDGKIVRDGETAEVLVVEATSPIDLAPDRSVATRTVISCWTGDNAAIPDAALGKACAAFRKSIAIAAD